MTDAISDFLFSVLKAIIVKILADFIYKYAKKGLRQAKPNLSRYVLISGLIISSLASKIKIESDSTFWFFFTLAIKTANHDQKRAMKNLLSQWNY